MTKQDLAKLDSVIRKLEKMQGLVGVAQFGLVNHATETMYRVREAIDPVNYPEWED